MSPYKPSFSPERFRKSRQHDSDYKRISSTPQESIQPDFLAGTTPLDADEEAALENSAYNGAAEDIAKNQGLSSGQLEAAESAGSSAKPTGADQEEGNSPSLFTGDNEGSGKAKGRFGRRKKLFGGGVAGLIIAAIFGGLTLTSGPLQFIHIAQLLQKFHFTNQEDASDDRMTKIGRYLRYHSDHPEKTRLNILGNKYADRIERKFNKSGIESSYTDRLGYLDGYVIDPARIPQDSELSNLSNKSPEEIQQHFKKNYDVDLTIRTDGTLFADADGLGYFKSKKMISSVLQEAGYSKLGASIRARIMGKRAGISWHPMKKLDRKLLESIDARYAQWQKDRQKRIDEGETTATTNEPEPSQDTDGDGNPDQPSEESTVAKGETDAVIKDAEAASKEVKTGVITPDGPLAKLRTSTGFKLAGAVSGAVGIVCLVKGIADNIDALKYANVVLPLIRLGMEMINVGNQVMSGQDFDIETLGFYAKKLHSDTTGSWASARSIQAELGDNPTGEDIRNEAKVADGQNSVSKFVNGIPAIGSVCKATNSKVGQAVSFGLDVLSGPISALSGQAFGYFLAPKLLDGLTNWIAGHPISLEVAGADFGNYMNFGARLAANDSFIAAGGKKLSGTETVELKQYQLESEKELQQSKSFAQRMFDPYDSNSLISKVIDQQNPEVGPNFARMTSGIVNVGSVFNAVPSMISSIMPAKASAASSYDYGFPLYGFSVSELNNEDTKNPYKNADDVAAILEGSKGKEFKERAVKCFGIGFQGTDNQPVSEASPPPSYKMPDTCTDSDSDWLKVRFYIFDTQLMESTVCYEGNEESCDDVGFADTVYTSSNTPTGPATRKIEGDPYTDSSSVSCATGTNDLGINDGYVDGNKFAVRLCSLPNLPSSGQADNQGSMYSTPGSSGFAVVNSRVSGAWFALINDAKAAGVPNIYVTSSFRSMQQQTDLFNTNPDPNYVARPGYSSHQAGVALDFAPMSITGGQDCGAGRARAPGDPLWDWLYANAEPYGFKQYSAESWHWDALPTANRCGSG